jgi:hypothetical protein
VQHHEAAIAGFVDRVRDDADVLGVIVTGSLARGRERVDSDVDLYLVVTEDEWDRAEAAHRLAWSDPEGADWEHGYFDIKLTTLPYLAEAAERGDDPVRDSFAASRVAWSRVPDLEQRVRAVAEVPEAQWAERAASFVAQARLHGDYFLVQADERDDPLLAANAALHLALAAARAMLARHRVLFQGPKYLSAALERLDDAPPGFHEALVRVVREPTAANGARVLELLEGAGDWGLPAELTLSRFIEDNELAWRTRIPPPEYR